MNFSDFLKAIIGYFSAKLSNQKKRFSTKSSKIFSKNFSRAFSLIEVSIVLLIIGVLIAATISAKAMIKNARIASAQAKTRAAPVNSIPDATIWLESSLEESFAAEEAEDGSEIKAWKDIKSSSAQDENDASFDTSAPVYSNTINGIQAVKFTSSDNTAMTINGTNLNNSDYTIFILEKRQASGDNYFLGDPDSVAGEDEQLLLGYAEGGSKVIHSQGGTNKYTANVGGYVASDENPRIFTFIQNASTGKKIYINGYLAGESADTSQLSNISTLKLGKGYTGEIGEFIVFNRALKGEERQSTEKYLQEKWRMSINAISTEAETCTSGEVTSTSGCDMSNASCDTPSSITGVDTLAASVDAGTGTIDCDNDNYTGSISYSCTLGVYSASTTCTPAAPCESVVIAGITDTGSITHLGSSSSSCNATGYDSSITLAYTCDNGSLDVTSTPDTCSCASNFSGSTCNQCATGFEDIATNSDCTSCDAAGGYVSDGSGGCRLGNSCPVGTAVTGSISGTTVVTAHLATGTVSCNATGYTSTATYSCEDGSTTITTACECNTSSGYIASGEECVLDECTGADSVSVKNGRKIYKFTTVGTANFRCPLAKTVNALIVAGGGGGGYVYGGGGGAGGFREITNKSINANQNYSVTVGAGGSPGVSGHRTGYNGGDSIFYGTTSKGGGGGGWTSGSGSSGGSGGGGGRHPDYVGGAGTVGQGFAGGNIDQENNYAAGGGGAGGVGTNAYKQWRIDHWRYAAGNGGPGKRATTSVAGEALWYASGGGGGNNKASDEVYGGSVSSGGGGRGGYGPGGISPQAGTPNTGGGGGGGATGNGNNGGSGIVIITYPAS